MGCNPSKGQAVTAAKSPVKTPSAPVEAPKVEVTKPVASPVKSTADPSLTVGFVMGGPGCGKSATCELIRDGFGFVIISSGPMLKNEVASGSATGKEVEKYIKENKMVPDNLMIQLIKAQIAKAGTKRFILDGFPRSVEQAKTFEREVAKTSFVIFLEASEKVMTERVQAREKTSGRADDNREPVEKQILNFKNETLPVVEYYDTLGKVKRCNANNTVSEIYAQAENHIKSIPGMTQVPKTVLFIFGGPGAGKSATCDLIKDEYGFVPLNAGQLLRAEVSTGSAQGKQIQQFMTDNKLVPDSVVIDLIKRAMTLSTSRKFIIDGFPKTVQQAKAWDQTAEPAVFSLFLEASEKTLSDRLMERAKTSGKIETPENVMKQINSWKAQTFPVVEYYEGLGKCKRVSANGSVRDIFSQTQAHLKTFSIPQSPPTVVFITGGPGAGKGTISDLLKEEFGFCTLSTGNLLREEIAAGSALGKQVEAIVKEGKLVSDSIMVSMLKNAMSKANNKKFIIDGFPRLETYSRI